MSTLLGWLTDPHPERGVRIADDRGGWEFVPYRELAASARRTGAAMRAAGLRPGEVVCLVLPGPRAFLTALFGAWAAGATAAPLAPPSFQGRAEYVTQLRAVLAQAAPALVVADEEAHEPVAEALGAAPWTPEEGPDEAPAAPAPLALLQFTSGSTGRPRGVRVSWRNLEANRVLQRRLIDWRAGEGIASWLPLHHDMGLIGCCLFAVAAQAPLWLMRPDQFIRDPARWLACFGPGGAAHSAAPSFAFAYAARRVRPERLAGLDLSGWRSVCVGAEPVDAAALDAFARFAAPAGFSPDAYLPSYGLAEHTLAVTAGGAPVRLVRPDWASLRFGGRVWIEESRTLGGAPVPPGGGWLVGHGLPAPQDAVTVRVLDEDGAALPAGHLGEIGLAGPSVTLGYQHAACTPRRGPGELRTGDAGFVHDGQLYVLGRMGDSLKLRARSVFVEDLDAKVAAAAGLDRDRVAVVAAHHEGRPAVAVFVEEPSGTWAAGVTEALRAELGPEPALTLVSGRRGLIQRTTSGKPRRRHLWQLLQERPLVRATILPTPGFAGEGGEQAPRCP